AFEVVDIGMGIPAAKQRIIFEAFQQADAGTSGKYGGTGLGLAISRELASLLGGEIQLRSTPGKGSTFTLYLPQTYVGPSASMLTREGRIPRAPLQLSAVNVVERTDEHIEDDRKNVQPDDSVLLIVEDNQHYARVLLDLARDKGFKVLVATRGADALALAREYHPSAVSLDVFLPDMLGWTVLNHLKQDSATRHIPVQMLTLDEDRHHGLARGAFGFVTKPTTPEGLKQALSRIKEFASPRRKRLKGVESPERLLDETALFLHRIVADLPAEKQRMLDRLHRSDEALVGRKVLVVDDDVRNIFALSSVLERRGMTVLTAGTGREAISILESTPDMAIVLMDIMMPEMDGYETMQVIRQNPSFRRLPIVALTAKAMKGDREKCLEAGASEYLAKPVNTEQLLSALRMWLHR